MPHAIHRFGRRLVHATSFLPESRVTNFLRWLKRPVAEDVVTPLLTGQQMCVPMREVSGFHIYVRGQHQPYVLQHLQRHLRPGMVVFDVGACIGLVTLTSAGIVGPTGQVHSFEPGKRQLEYLRKNVALNGYENIVHVNPIAVSDVEGTVGYVVGRAVNIGGSHIAAAGEGEAVPCTTLDRYMEQNGVERVDCLKMDVEGSELRVLKGFARAMDGPAPPSLVLYECDDCTCREQGHTSADVHGFFFDRGYEVHKSRGGRVTRRTAGSHTWQNDFVAILRR